MERMRVGESEWWCRQAAREQRRKLTAEFLKSETGGGGVARLREAEDSRHDMR